MRRDIKKRAMVAGLVPLCVAHLAAARDYEAPAVPDTDTCAPLALVQTGGDSADSPDYVIFVVV